MKLRNISFENLKRRKSKMAFMIIGMVIGIATVITIFQVTRTMQQDVEKKIDEFGANIMILPRSNTLSMSYGGISIPGANYDVQEIKEDELDEIWKIENAGNLSTVSAKLLGAVDVGGEMVLSVGVDLSIEIKLKKWWKFTEDSTIELTRVEKPSPIDATRNITDTAIKGLKETDILVGSRVAEKLSLKAGGYLSVSRRGNTDKLFIKGVLKSTGSQDDSIIFMDLHKAQSLLDKEDKITMVEVAALCAGCPVEELAAQINSVMPNGLATPIKQVVEQKMQTIVQLTTFGYLIGIIILVIGSLIVFTTMMGSVNERIREIGIFRAIGFRKSHIFKIILLEALIISFIAGVVGYVLGIGSTMLTAPILTGNNIGIPFDPYLAVGSIVLAILVGTVAAIFPAHRASNIDPTEALRHI